MKRAIEGTQVLLDKAAYATHTKRAVQLLKRGNLGQLVAVAILEILTEEDEWKLLLSEAGMGMLHDSVRGHLKIFLSRDRVQNPLRQWWRGEALSYFLWHGEHRLRDRGSFEKHRRMQLMLLLAIPANLLILPFTAAFPPLHRRLEQLGALSCGLTLASLFRCPSTPPALPVQAQIDMLTHLLFRAAVQGVRFGIPRTTT